VSRAGRLLAALRHPVASNAAWLYAQSFAITLLPLVTLPYLTRVLGPSELGVVLFTQSFAFLLALVAEYGFGLSGARAAAGRREDPAGLADVVAGIQGAKVALCVACVGLALVAWPLVPAFRAQPELVALGLATGILQGLSPWWLFAGLEVMRRPAALELALRGLTVVAIVVLVDDAGDGAIVLGIYLAAQALSTLPLTVWLYRLVAWRPPTWQLTRAALRDGWILFVSGGAVALYTSANVFLLGLLVAPAQLAFFAAAEKTIRAAMRVLSAVEAAVYPRISFLVSQGRTSRADQLALMTLVGLAGVSLLCALALFLLAPVVVELVFGPAFAPSVEVLRVVAFAIPLGLAALTISQQWLLPRGLERYTTLVVICTGVVNPVALLVLTPAFGIVGAAWSLLAVEAMALSGQLLVMRRVGLLGGTRSARRSRPVPAP